MHQGAGPQRQGGLRLRSVRRRRARGQEPGPRHHLQRGDRQERGELPLRGLQGQGRRRRLHVLRGRDRQRRGAALQGLRGRAAGREVLRRRRRVRERLRQREAGRHPGERRGEDEVHRGDPASGRVPRRGQAVLHRLHQEVRREEPRSVRDLRLRGHASRGRLDPAFEDRQEGRRAQGAVRHQGPPERARHVLHRRERRHVADGLRRLRPHRRRGQVRQGHQAQAQ